MMLRKLKWRRYYTNTYIYMIGVQYIGHVKGKTHTNLDGGPWAQHLTILGYYSLFNFGLSKLSYLLKKLHNL